MAQYRVSRKRGSNLTDEECSEVQHGALAKMGRNSTGEAWSSMEAETSLVKSENIVRKKGAEALHVKLTHHRASEKTGRNLTGEVAQDRASDKSSRNVTSTVTHEQFFFISSSIRLQLSATGIRETSP